MSDDIPSSSIRDVRVGSYTDQPKRIIIQLFNNLLRTELGNVPCLQEVGTPAKWIRLVFSQSDVFYGYDELMWGAFVICVYHDPLDSQLSCLLVDKVGVSHFAGIDITEKSQYYPAIENLASIHRNSESRQCIAVTFLLRFSQLSEKDVNRLHPGTFKFDYDPTHAGDLASICTQVKDEKKIASTGRKLVSLGIFRERLVKSVLLDVIYERHERASESNNRMVFNLGRQLEQLFNPLTEYSPEHTEYTYNAPTMDSPTEEDDALVKAILNELLELQTNFTLSLVEFLQNFVITLRVQVLNNRIGGLSTIKLNRLFPPTIDEVTRVNCIFLDSLKSATPFGSLEVLKACSITIPYFYKAYTRHEAATKYFNRDIKLFLENFGAEMPHADFFTEMKIDSLIKGPQEKLMKIKLIIDRLYASKKWNPPNRKVAKKCYDNVIKVIDSFGRLAGPLNTYNSRVFTPSGRILTELAEGWPTELQFKSFKRRLIGVFDMVDLSNSINGRLLVIFSDYLIFLEILDNGIRHSNLNKPSLSDVFMNSLANEVPLPSNIPRLRVIYYSYIDEILVTPFDNESLRFDALKGQASFAVTLKLQSKSLSAYTLSDLVTKAKILEKNTAFHLFKALHNDITIYSTAHEVEAYNSESIKSTFALFLNIKPSKKLIVKHKLHVAMFAKFVPDNTELVQLDILTSDGGFQTIRSAVANLVPTILYQLSFEIPICFSSIYSPLVPLLLAANESIVKDFGYFDPEEYSNLKVISRNIGKSRAVSSSVAESHFQDRPAKSYPMSTMFTNVSEGKAANNTDSPDIFDFEELEQSKKSQLDLQDALKKRDKKKLFPEEKGRHLLSHEVQSTAGKLEKQQKKGSIGSVLKSIFGSKKKSTGNIKNKNTEKREPDQERSRRLKKGGALSDTKPKFNKSKRGGNHSISKADIKIFPSNGRVPNELPILTRKPAKVADERRHLSLPLGSFEERTGAEFNKRSSTVSDPLRCVASVKNNRNSIISKKPIIPRMMNRATGEISTLQESNVLSAQPSVDVSENPGRASTKDLVTVSQSNYDDFRDMNQMRVSQDDHTNGLRSGRIQGCAMVENLEKKSSHEGRMFDDELFADIIPNSEKSSSRPTVNEVDTTGSNRRKSTFEKNAGIVTSTVPTTVEKDGIKDFTLQSKDLKNVVRTQNRTENGQKTSDGLRDPRLPSEKTKQRNSRIKFGNSEGVDFAVNSFERSSRNAIDMRFQKLTASKIDFERSPSFVQLFQGMRLVFDESDAKYNWKRLPSEYSLRDTSPINCDEETLQQYQTDPRSKPLRSVCTNLEPKLDMSPTTRQSVLHKSSMSKIDHGKLGDSSIQAVPKNAFVSPENPIFSADGACSSQMHGKEQPQMDISKNAFEEIVASNDVSKLPIESSQKRSVKKKAPMFKVVNQSPTRIVSINAPSRPASPYNIPSDISIISDLEEHGNERLFELKFPSKEDFTDRRKTSPLREPIYRPLLDVSTRAVEYISESSSVIHKDKDSNMVPGDSSSLPEQKASRKSNVGLLEDLNFSSFNVTFDHFNRDPDISQMDAVHSNVSSIAMVTKGTLPTTLRNPSMEEPIMYHFSTSIENSADKFSPNESPNIHQQSHKDDDPIWISPSKLDYYDVSKVGDLQFKDTEEGCDKSAIMNNNRPRCFAENPSSLNELSYAYLASVIDDDDDDRHSSVAEHKPIRLAFKE